MLERGKCLLRPTKPEDLERILEWRNSDRVRSCMFTDAIISWNEHLAWFERVSKSGISKHLLFEYNGQPLGVVNITNIDLQNNKCHWGFYIGEEGAPRGSGRAMGFLAIEHIFENLSMRKLCGRAFAFNLASVKFHLKLGFEEEGLLRKHILKNGDFMDVYCFAHFIDRWREHRQQLDQYCFGR